MKKQEKSSEEKSEILRIRAEIISGKSSAKKEVEKAFAKFEKVKNLHALTEILPEFAKKRAEKIDEKIAEIREKNGAKKDEILDEKSEKFAKIEKEVVAEIGILAGVPYVAKDNFLTKAEKSHSTASSTFFANFKSPIDATAVKKLDDAGAVMIGKSNLDAFAHGGSTENSAFGPTKNAVDETRVAGGSSGGSAAIVAVGVVPFALGSDTGGSIREPASFNGVVGWKPSYGLISRYGVFAMASSTDVIGTFSRNVKDAEILTEILAGKDGHDGTLTAGNWDKISRKTDHENAKLLETYEEKSLEYIADTTQHYAEKRGEYDEWRAKTIKNLPKTAKIFEIGSGYGRDAEFFAKNGYEIQTSDAAENFVNELKKRGFDPIRFNVLTDEFLRKYDMIFASVVIHHFDKKSAEKIFAKVYDALEIGGKFAFSVASGSEKISGGKLGENMIWYPWEDEEIREKLLEIGFSEVEIFHKTGKLIKIIARKTKDDFSKIPTKKVGLTKEFLGDGVDPEVRENALKFAEKLRENGVEVDEISLPMAKYALAIYYIVVPAELSSNLARFDGVRYGARAGEKFAKISEQENRFIAEDSEIARKENLKTEAKNPDELFTNSRNFGFADENKRRLMIGAFVLSSGYFDAYYLKAQKARTLLIQQFNDLFAKYDFLIGPVAPTPAFKLGENTKDPLKMYMTDLLTTPASMAGIPAISLPNGFAKNGLPIGIQIMAQMKNDAELLEFAKNCEENFAKNSDKNGGEK